MQIILMPSAKTLGPALKQITQKSYKDDTLEDFLGTLASLSDRDITDRSILRHLSFSFLGVAAADTVQESLERTHLDHIIFDTIRRGFTGFILSGTVSNFRDAILECCDSTSTTDIRELYNEIYLQLQRAGLRRIWSTQTKKITDGTFSVSKK